MARVVRFAVCTRGKKCPKRGSKDVLKAIEKAIEDRKLKEQAATMGCKCLKKCGKGPTIAVTGQPAGVTLYGRVKPKDADALVTAHVKNGAAVEKLCIKRKKKKK